MSIRSQFRCVSMAAGLSLLANGVMAAPGPEPEPAAAASATAVPTGVPAAAHPDFSGDWKLDPKASDDPAAIPGGDGRGKGGHGGQGSPGGRGGRGQGGGRGPAADPNSGRMPGESFDGSDGPERDRDEAMGRQSAREFGQLEIFHAGDEFNLTDGMQISRMLRIGGQPTEVFTPRGTVKAAAAWDGGALVVTESDPQGQVRRTRQFLLSNDGGTLTVREIRHGPGKDGDHALTMVYRRQTDPGKP